MLCRKCEVLHCTKIKFKQGKNKCKNMISVTHKILVCQNNVGKIEQEANIVRSIEPNIIANLFESWNLKRHKEHETPFSPFSELIKQRITYLTQKIMFFLRGEMKSYQSYKLTRSSQMLPNFHKTCFRSYLWIRKSFGKKPRKSLHNIPTDK